MSEVGPIYRKVLTILNDFEFGDHQPRENILERFLLQASAELQNNQKNNEVSATFTQILYFCLQHKCGSKIDSLISKYLEDLFQTWNLNESNKELIKKVILFKNLDFHKHYSKQLNQTLFKIIDKKTSTLYHSSYSNPYLATLKPWFEEKLCKFYLLLGDDSSSLPEKMSIFSDYLLISIAKIRTKELFEIIADFPDSMVSIKELKDCSSNSPESQIHIGKSFQSVLLKRLLHPGASTNQILDMYISMIRALRIIDSSDLLLNFIATPIRAYLKNRKDTVQCIVHSLSQGNDSDLHLELKKGSSLEYADDEENDEIVEFWEPKKRNPELTTDAQRGGMDVLALLVSIYG
jgi:hypothetical protein